MDDRILFLGFCWGAAGTTWLARLLNSHEDVFCQHAPMFPRYDHFRLAEAMEIIDVVLNEQAFGGAYPVVGFTHGIAAEWYDALREKYGQRLRCFGVTRHPIPRIQSTLELNVEKKERRTSDPTWQRAFAETYDTLRQLSNKDFPDDFESLAFYKACAMVNSITWERQQDFPLFRLEDLISQEPAVQQLLSHVSDGACQLAATVVQRMQQTVVRPHARRTLTVAETYGSWRAEHREAFHYLVTAPSLAEYCQLGYELPAAALTGGAAV
jgi:hypothetical protein